MSISTYIIATLLASTAVAGTMAALAWRQRPEPGATWLAATMGAVLWWTGTYTMVLTVETPLARALWGWIQWIGIVSLPVVWLRFVFEYTGRDELVTRARFAGLLVVPAITLVGVWTNGFVHDLMFPAIETAQFGELVVYQVEYGPLFWLHIGYSYLLLLTGVLVLLDLVLSSNSLYRFQAGVLTFGAVVPWVASLVSIAGQTPIPGFDPLPIAFLATGLSGIAALTKFDLFESVPVARRVGRGAVVDRLDDAVVVLDANDRIVDANPAADAVLDPSPDEAVGQSATEAFPESVHESLLPLAAEGSELGSPVTFDAPGTGKLSRTVELEGDDPRYFDIRESALTDQHGRVVGRVVALRDVTWRKERERRLDVLNRILRGKLTDGSDALSAYADDADGARAEIRDVATAADAVGQKAETIETLLEEEASAEPVDLVPMVQEELDRVRSQYPFVSFEADVRLGDWGYCDGVIQPAVRNLLENAARHNTASDPEVIVRVFSNDDRGTEQIVIEDNGPGLTEDQRRILLDGDVSAPERSDGLGLWLVNWSVRQVGGEIEYEKRDPRGSVITLHVPEYDGADERAQTVAVTR